MSNFDINKYQGTWHEIAKFPFKWEKNCVNITAEYYVRPDYLQIVNSCGIVKDGGLYTFKRYGKGYKSENPMDLKIIFDDGLPNDGLGDYRILFTDYNYSIVGSTEKDKLWILARIRQISNKDYNILLEMCKKIGYDVSKLEISRII